MARLTVYLPDDLMDEVKKARKAVSRPNLSRMCAEAIRDNLGLPEPKAPLHPRWGWRYRVESVASGTDHTNMEVLLEDKLNGLGAEWDVFRVEPRADGSYRIFARKSIRLKD